MDKKSMINLLNNKTSLRTKLFCRGFLFTDKLLDSNGYPFYNLWNYETINQSEKKYFLYIHPDLNYIIKKINDRFVILIGHAYNPFDNVYKEQEIVDKLLDFINDENEFFSNINKLTGVFTIIYSDGKDLRLLNDATGMQITFYGKYKENLYISTHSKLIGDICDLEIDDYIKRLVNYRFYSLFGNQLPGDLSPYSNFKRLVPNHYIVFSKQRVDIVRFYPMNKIKILNEYEELIYRIENILKTSLKLISKKWRKPAISMTGGCDSKTTFACANGIYDKFSYFSYVSSKEEEIDAIAAHDICSFFNLSHKIHRISDNNSDFCDFQDVKNILEYNSGCIGTNNENDIRKRIYFDQIDEFDVEVKSWVSEIGRAYYSKRFLKNKFPKKPNPKFCRCLYKVFINDRKLIKETDKIFDDYIKKYKLENFCDEWWELFFWEFRMSSWNGLVITGEHRYSFDITIPYNNRILLNYFLSIPSELRQKDLVHKKIRELANNEVNKIQVDIVNKRHTKNRARCERIYLELYSKF